MISIHALIVEASDILHKDVIVNGATGTMLQIIEMETWITVYRIQTLTRHLLLLVYTNIDQTLVHC